MSLSLYAFPEPAGACREAHRHSCRLLEPLVCFEQQNDCAGHLEKDQYSILSWQSGSSEKCQDLSVDTQLVEESALELTQLLRLSLWL